MTVTITLTKAQRDRMAHAFRVAAELALSSHKIGPITMASRQLDIPEGDFFDAANVAGVSLFGTSSRLAKSPGARMDADTYRSRLLAVAEALDTGRPVQSEMPA